MTQYPQVELYECNTNDIMSHTTFRKGMDDHLNGYAIDDNVHRTVSWMYERGRLFSACYPHVNLLNVEPHEGVVPFALQVLFDKAWDEGTII